jgi:hypothetical protein
MYAFPQGNSAIVLAVDSTETMMALSGGGTAKPTVAKAHIYGATLQATFPTPGLIPMTWSLAPQPDGVTASVRLQAFMNDNTASFHRVAESNTAKPAR